MHTILSTLLLTFIPLRQSFRISPLTKVFSSYSQCTFCLRVLSSTPNKLFIVCTHTIRGLFTRLVNVAARLRASVAEAAVSTRAQKWRHGDRLVTAPEVWAPWATHASTSPADPHHQRQLEMSTSCSLCPLCPAANGIIFSLAALRLGARISSLLTVFLHD